MFNPDGQEDTAISPEIRTQLSGVDIDLHECKDDALMDTAEMSEHKDINDMAEESAINVDDIEPKIIS